jgi:very-short-patch-repair endonuclease
MHVDRAIATVAGRQHAMIATRQLAGLGLTRSAVAKRVRAGRLTPHIRGVYLVGPVMPPLGPESAALLACPGAVLSHLSAAALWGIAQRPDAVHVTAASNKRSRAGVRTHRGALAPRDVRVRQGLSLTSPYRTVLDLRHHVSAETLKRITWEASYRKLISDDQAQRLLGASPPLARFEAERLLVELLTGAGLPQPLTNQRLHGWEVDLYWPEHRVVVELDGYDAHGGHRAGFERDHRKALALEARGIRVLRISGAQLTDEATTIVATAAGALAQRA